MSMVVEPDREPLGEQSVSKPTRGCPRTRGPGLLVGCRVVLTQPFAIAHVLAQPASCE